MVNLSHSTLCLGIDNVRHSWSVYFSMLENRTKNIRISIKKEFKKQFKRSRFNKQTRAGCTLYRYIHNETPTDIRPINFLRFSCTLIRSQIRCKANLNEDCLPPAFESRNRLSKLVLRQSRTFYLFRLKKTLDVIENHEVLTLKF